MGSRRNPGPSPRLTKAEGFFKEGNEYSTCRLVKFKFKIIIITIKKKVCMDLIWKPLNLICPLLESWIFSPKPRNRSFAGNLHSQREQMATEAIT